MDPMKIVTALIDLAIQLVGLEAVKNHVLSQETITETNLEIDALENAKFGPKGS